MLQPLVLIPLRTIVRVAVLVGLLVVVLILLLAGPSQSVHAADGAQCPVPSHVG